MKIIWSPLAVEQARDIASYIALDKPTVAKKWVENIFDCVNSLIEHPESGRTVPEIQRNDIREIIQGNYRVIYKTSQNAIHILVVKNFRQILKPDELID